MTPQERFWQKVAKGGPDDCWMWTGGKADHGYGLIYIDGKNRRTHVISWEWANDCKAPKGMSVCHTCDTPSCVNPAHLWLGTHRENLQDAGRKGRVGHKVGTPAWNANKTHCDRGHRLPDKKDGRGWRVCVECKRITDAARHKRNRAALSRGEEVMTSEERAKALYDYLNFAPTDKWEANILASITEAVAAETERCAKCVDDENPLDDWLLNQIAAAIRAQTRGEGE